MRISIRKNNRVLLERLAAQMECDPTETINYLLTELRRIGYSFNTGMTLAVGGIDSSQCSSPDLVSELQTRPKETGSTGSLMVALEKDPVIERILSAGLEVF